jgi:hypothetical protein
MQVLLRNLFLRIAPHRISFLTRKKRKMVGRIAQVMSFEQ